MPGVLVLTPDPLEASGVQQAFARRGIAHQPARIGSLDCLTVPALDLIVAIGGNGKAQYGVQAQYLIDRCADAKALICLGAAGALSDRVGIDDVVLGTATVEHDYRERFVPQPLPRHDGSAQVLREFAAAARSTVFSFGIHQGVIASGDEDIVDADRAREIRESTGALCAAWEGSGGARAARLNGLEFLELRGITDAADPSAAQFFHANVAEVMDHAVQLLSAWAASRAPIAPRSQAV
jgi:adenosylhomocysteine nucleosidase